MDFTNKPSDFKKPDEKPAPVEEAQRPTEPVLIPAHAAGAHKGRKAAGVALASLLVLGLVTAAGWFWWQERNARAALQQNAVLQEQLLQENQKLRQAAPGKDEAVAEVPKLTQEEEIRLSASTYACALKDFGCDKNTFTILVQRAPKIDAVGIASVRVESATKRSTVLNLVQESGAGWVVIYDGQGLPPADVAGKFGVSSGDFKQSQ